MWYPALGKSDLIRDSEFSFNSRIFPFILGALVLSFDDDKNTLADAVDKYYIRVPPIQWLAWIPQLLTCLVGSEGKLLLNLISQVGRRLVFGHKNSSFHIFFSKGKYSCSKFWN